jgi:hypothetical protein
VSRRFRTLLVGHLPSDPAEATLVLAAAAALCGLRSDGSPMPEARPHAPSLREIAAELGLAVSAVRRGVRHLEQCGAVRHDDGVHVAAEALAARWQDVRQRCRLTAEARSHGLRAAPLLLAALVAGQIDERGRLCLGRRFLSERLGLPQRTLDRALATVCQAGVLHRWTVGNGFGGGQMFLALGPSRSGEPEGGNGRDLASRNGEPAVTKRRTGRAETANRPSRRGERHPDCHPDNPDTPDARVRARGASPAAADPHPAEPETKPATERDPAQALMSAVLRTSLRSKLRPFDRLRFAAQLVPALRRTGMVAEDLDALWALAQVRSREDDPGGLLTHWLAGDWRGVLDEQVMKRRHADALARARAAQGRGDGEIVMATVRHGADVAKAVLGQVTVG